MASLLCGDDTGFIKRVNLKDGSSLSRLGFQAPGRAVHSLAWAGSGPWGSASGEWEAREKEVLVGYRSGAVELYNTQTKELIAKFDALSLPPTEALRASAAAAASASFDPAVRAPRSVNATSALVGLAVLQPQGVSSVAAAAHSHERRLITCSSGGVLHVRPFSTLSLDDSEQEQPMEDVPAPATNGKAKKGKKGASPSLSAASSPATPSAALAIAPSHVAASGASTMVVGSHICALKVEPSLQSLFACGGKEHMLKLWDLGSATCVWKEKNVPHDMLNLRQQVWITDLAFVPGGGGHELVTGTAWHQIRSYDTRANKRAIFNIEVSDHAITCVDVSADGRSILVGDGGGRLQQRDRRMAGRMMHVYHGIGGSVRGIHAHPSLPLLAACGLDRFMRVYDVNTRKQLHKVYLKQKLNAVLFSAQTPNEAQAVEEAEAEAAALAAARPDDDGDELWAELHQRAQRIKQEGEEGGAQQVSGGVGLYVKKRKTAAELSDDEDEDGADEPRAKKGKVAHPKVKLEPMDDVTPAAAAPAPAPAATRTIAKPAAPKGSALAAARGQALQSTGLKDGQISFRQAIVYDEDEGSDEGEEGEDGEDEEGEDEEEEGEDGEEESDDEEEGEDEEEEEPAPAPAPTPRKGRASAAPAPASTRSLRARSAR